MTAWLCWALLKITARETYLEKDPVKAVDYKKFSIPFTSVFFYYNVRALLCFWGRQFHLSLCDQWFTNDVVLNIMPKLKFFGNFWKFFKMIFQDI